MCFILFLFVFFNKSDHDVKSNWGLSIFLSRIISIIMQKNTLCTSKINVIYFFPNSVNVLPEKVHFFFYFVFHLFINLFLFFILYICLFFWGEEWFSFILFLNDNVKSVLWESMGRFEICLNQMFVMRIILENGFESTLKSKVTVLYVWR